MPAARSVASSLASRVTADGFEPPRTAQLRPQSGECEQVEIAGDDELGACGKRARENVVIVGIARDAWHVDGLDELDGFEVVDHDLRRSLADRGEALGQRRAIGDVGEFFDERGAAVEPKVLLPANRLEQSIRRAAPQERGDHHVRVEHEPHAITSALVACVRGVRRARP